MRTKNFSKILQETYPNFIRGEKFDKLELKILVKKATSLQQFFI